MHQVEVLDERFAECPRNRFRSTVGHETLDDFSPDLCSQQLQQRRNIVSIKQPIETRPVTTCCEFLLYPLQTLHDPVEVITAADRTPGLEPGKARDRLTGRRIEPDGVTAPKRFRQPCDQGIYTWPLFLLWPLRFIMVLLDWGSASEVDVECDIERSSMAGHLYQGRRQRFAYPFPVGDVDHLQSRSCIECFGRGNRQTYDPELTDE
jgi:hypothetical protein